MRTPTCVRQKALYIPAEAPHSTFYITLAQVLVPATYRPLLMSTMYVTLCIALLGSINANTARPVQVTDSMMPCNTSVTVVWYLCTIVMMLLKAMPLQGEKPLTILYINVVVVLIKPSSLASKLLLIGAALMQSLNSELK
jgi:hypothetical protein